MEFLFESPCWDPRRTCVWFVNVYQGELWTFKGGAVSLEQRFNGIVSSVNLCRSGALLITTKNQIIAFDPEMDLLNVLHEFEFEHSSIRLNDCKVADNGNLVYSYFMDKKPRQFYGSVGVYSKKEGALEILKNQFITPNGIVTDSKSDIFWISDTGQSKIYQFPYSAILSPWLNFDLTPSKIISVPKDFGRPDGGSLDADGCYWVALLDFGMVGCWSSDGSLLKLLPLKTKYPTMVSFWGETLDLALVTKKVVAKNLGSDLGVENFLPLSRGKPANFFEDMQ